MIGKVKFFHSLKQFGFISTPDQPDLFFHFADQPTDFSVSIGDEVSFDIDTGLKGNRAINIKKIVS